MSDKHQNSAASRSVYFVNPVVDYALMGVSSIIPYLLTRFYSFGRMPTWQFTLLIFVNWPHFSAAVQRLYGTPQNLRRFPLTCFVLPLLMIAGVAGAMHDPTGFAPFYVKLSLMWASYHYAAQTYGITLIYARRSGFHPGYLDKRLLSGFIFGATLASLVIVETSVGMGKYGPVEFPYLQLPLWTAKVAQYAFLAVGTAFVLRWCFLNPTPLPIIVFVPGFVHYAWYLIFPLGNPATFAPFFHCAQYLLVSWSAWARARLGPGERVWDRKLALASSRWALTNILGGIALFLGIPYLLTGEGMGTALIFSLISVTIQLHHVIIDAVIWRLRSPAVSGALRIPNFGRMATVPA